MNKHFRKIKEISDKNERLIVGLMSGTSLDGLDIVLCSISNSEGIKQLHFETCEFGDELKSKLQSIAFRDQVDLKLLNILNSELGDFYAEAVLKTLKKWSVSPSDVDLIGSHGQTIYHSPDAYQYSDKKRTATLQIGDGDHIARKTGIITISDFRQKDTASGGQGAPLAKHLDSYVFSDPDKSRILLNLGGIANFTLIPSDSDDVVCSDIGPANTLINQAMRIFYSKGFDKNGEVARSGKVHQALLSELMRHEFIQKSFPKTTGPEEFNITWVQKVIKGLNVDDLFSEDIVCTLTEFTAESISMALSKLSADEIFISGGGIHNDFLMNQLRKLLPELSFRDIEEFGISADAKEAVLMAYLADDLVMHGEINLGKISIP